MTLPLALAAYSSERQADVSEQGKLWLLDPSPPNSVTIRLRPGLDQPPLAEIRVAAR